MLPDIRDFFISYNQADKSWAEWIACQLEDAGYSVFMQDWDFRAGNNFIIEMQNAILNTQNTIAILSDDYFDAKYTYPEWAAALAQDPEGKGRKLIPIRVRKCSPKGLLKPIVYIDLFGISEKDAKGILLRNIQNERLKPNRAPEFPGGHAHELHISTEGIDNDSSCISSASVGLPDRNFPGFDLSTNPDAVLDKTYGYNFLEEILPNYASNYLEKNKGNNGKRKLAILMSDVDDLTIINKHYGTEAGDLVLLAVSTILGDLRISDYFGRCGDDTFYMVLPGLSTNEAKKFGNRLRKRVGRHQWEGIADGLRVTLSIGVASLKNNKPVADSVIRAAKGFQAAKARGKGRIEVGPELLSKNESRRFRDHFSY